MALSYISVMNMTIKEYFVTTKTTNPQQQNNLTIFSPTTNNETQSHVDEGFSKVKSLLYQTASSPTTGTTQRTPFILDDSWVRGNGGLDDADRSVLGRIYFHAQSVFEFGLGESTLIAAAVNVPRYSGVDSDAEWVAQARKNSKRSHFRFNFADIGETKAWGYPVKQLRKNTYDYQFGALAGEEDAFDVYLVDGRYRVACVCVAFLHAMQHRGDMEKVRVGIHDNHTPGRGYNVINNTIGELMIKNKRLWVYKLKNGTTVDDVIELWKSKHDTLVRR